MAEKEFFYLDEVEQITGIKEATLKKRCQRGSLPAEKKLRGKDEAWAISKATLQALTAGSKANEYDALVEEWENAQRFGTLTGKRLKDKTVNHNSLYLSLLWTRVDEKPSIKALNADTFKKAMWKILSDSKPDNDHYSVRSNTYKAVCSFFKLLIEKGLKTESDLNLIKRQCPKRSVPERRTSLDQEQLIQFFKANEEGRHKGASYNRELNKVMFMLWVCLGMRKSEALNVELDRINMETGRIEFIGKNSKWRIVYANEEMMQVIKSWLPTRAKCKYPNKPYLLLTKDGKQVSATNANTRFTRNRERAGLNGKITIHGLRMTFATFWMNNGNSLHDLKEILGHEKVSVTDLYIRTNRERSAKQMQDFSLGIVSTPKDDRHTASHDKQKTKKKRIRDAWG